MALEACKECGKDVADMALTCPHCGARGPGATANSYANAVVAALILFGLLWYFGVLKDWGVVL